MKSKFFNVFLFSFLSFTICLANGRLRSGMQEKRTEILSDRYKVEWQANFDEETIEFVVTVNTTGFVGFGLSHSGVMTGADIVIGGVDAANNGERYFQDYHGVGNTAPVIDIESNWDLLEASEDAGMTVLKFKRKLDTCDPNNEDIAITEGTVKIIWSIGATDDIVYHEVRGALAVNMLDPPLSDVDLSTFSQTNFSQVVSVTAEKDTIYWCSIFGRNSTSKSHIVAFKPKFDSADALRHTHHFNVYVCKAPEGQNPIEYFEHFASPGYPGEDCFKNVPNGIPRHACKAALYAWSLGGRLLVFPDDIGFPWGYDENEYFLFEVHLDNKDFRDATFETGITIYDTEEFRPKEAGMLTIGHSTGPSLVIPPRTSDWQLVGHCSSDCTQKHLDQDGINIFNVNLHAHLAGSKMRLRQFRNGKELPWIANDNNYDADYQENRPLVEEIRFLPGDHISMECTYDNGNSDDAVIGGFATVDEMCMLFAFYYPKSDLDGCASGYPVIDVFNYFGIENATYEHEGSLDPTINLPEKWRGKAYSEVLRSEIEWTQEYKAKLQEGLLNGDHEDYCISKDSENILGVGKSLKLQSGNRNEYATVTYPEIDEPYEEPETCARAIQLKF